MSDAKHTGGEWWVERADEYDRKSGRVHLRSIILAPPIGDGSDPEPVAYVDSEADCRLFLAASDLLAASIEVMNATDGPAGSLRRFRDAQRQMVAAIAKATGDSSPKVGVMADDDASTELTALREACQKALAVLISYKLGTGFPTLADLYDAIAKATGNN